MAILKGMALQLHETRMHGIAWWKAAACAVQLQLCARTWRMPQPAREKASAAFNRQSLIIHLDQTGILE